jgi:prepilin-type N-terminal cleavage/methylation domain-containing protein
MNAQSGRSLIEMLGVLAIGGVIAAGAVETYRVVRSRQTRTFAEQELKNIAENAKILYSGRKNYSGIGKSYLIKAGALKVEKIGDNDFRIAAAEDGKSFSIIFDNMNFGDCSYFATKKYEWAAGVAVNGFSDDPSSLCAESHPNKLEFIIK